MSSPQTAMVIREAYDSTAQRINNSVGYLAENGVPRIDPQLIPLVRQMISAGGGEGNVFQAMDAHLNLVSSENELIAANKAILDELLREADALVEDVRQGTSISGQAAGTLERGVLLALGGIGMLGTLPIGGYCGSRSKPT